MVRRRTRVGRSDMSVRFFCDAIAVPPQAHAAGSDYGMNPSSSVPGKTHVITRGTSKASRGPGRCLPLRLEAASRGPMILLIEDNPNDVLLTQVAMQQCNIASSLQVAED